MTPDLGRELRLLVRRVHDPTPVDIKHGHVSQGLVKCAPSPVTRVDSTGHRLCEGGGYYGQVGNRSGRKLVVLLAQTRIGSERGLSRVCSTRCERTECAVGVVVRFTQVRFTKRFWGLRLLHTPVTRFDSTGQRLSADDGYYGQARHLMVGAAPLILRMST